MSDESCKNDQVVMNVLSCGNSKFLLMSVMYISGYAKLYFDLMTKNVETAKTTTCSRQHTLNKNR